jgi:hypothetical protein
MLLNIVKIHIFNEIIKTWHILGDFLIYIIIYYNFLNQIWFIQAFRKNILKIFQGKQLHKQVGVALFNVEEPFSSTRSQSYWSILILSMWKHHFYKKPNLLFNTNWVLFQKPFAHVQKTCEIWRPFLGDHKIF